MHIRAFKMRTQSERARVLSRNSMMGEDGVHNGMRTGCVSVGTRLQATHQSGSSNLPSGPALCSSHAKGIECRRGGSKENKMAVSLG